MTESWQKEEQVLSLFVTHSKERDHTYNGLLQKYLYRIRLGGLQGVPRNFKECDICLEVHDSKLFKKHHSKW